MNVDDYLLNCLRELKRPLVASAAQGWEYAARIDRPFLWDSTDHQNSAPAQGLPKDTLRKTIQFGNSSELQPRSTESLLDDLLNLVRNDPDRALFHIEKLCNTSAPELFLDNYFSLGLNQFYKDISDFFRKKIIIFGAGPVGLSFANMIKQKRPDLDIYMIEKRIYQSGFKKRYTRNWATHLPHSIYADRIDSRVSELFKIAGNDHYIGGKIYIIESLLLLSCKENGVRFIFDELDYKKLCATAKSAVFFDATGGRLVSATHTLRSKDYQIPIQNVTLASPNLKEGHRGHGIQTQYMSDNFDVQISQNGSTLTPTLDNVSIQSSMFKLTGIRVRYYNAIMEYVKEINNDNRFYIWPGQIHQSENEILILINISQKEYQIFQTIIQEKLTLDALYDQLKTQDKSVIDSRLIEFLKFLGKSCQETEPEIFAEPAFIYKPYFRDIWNYEVNLHGRKVVPLGDSIFTGHPKVGNGLGSHLQIAYYLCDKVDGALGM